MAKKRSGQVKLYKFKISLKDLKKAPKQEQVFFVKALELAQEINTLQKLMLLSDNVKRKKGSVQESAQINLSLYFIRILAGALCEAFKFIRLYYCLEILDHEKKLKSYAKKKSLKCLIHTYKNLMRNNGNESLVKIREYFSKTGKTNTIKTIRNKFAYHHDFPAIYKNIDTVLDEADPIVFLSERSGNCHYQFAANLNTAALIHEIGLAKDQYKEGLERIIGETIKMAGHFGNFLNDYITAFCIKYLNLQNADLADLESQEIKAAVLKYSKLNYFAMIE